MCSLGREGSMPGTKNCTKTFNSAKSFHTCALSFPGQSAIPSEAELLIICFAGCKEPSMNALLDFVGSPLLGILVIVLFGPLTIALMCRAWRGDGRPKARQSTVQEPPRNAGLRVNRLYAGRFGREDLRPQPARRLAVVTCMDARLPVEQLLGLKLGDAHIIRNAGGIVTEDAIRSLLVSHYLLGTQEFLIINHTDCGMMTFTDAELSDRLQHLTGKKTAIPFHAFRDLHDNVRRQVENVKAHPWMPADVPVRGFIYDLRTGRLQEVMDHQNNMSKDGVLTARDFGSNDDGDLS
jgi:carbonic anhydrase